MMEFLVLVAAYLGSLAFALLLYLLRDVPAVASILRAMHSCIKVFQVFLPSKMKNVSIEAADKYFYQRNRVFQFIFLFLVALGYLVLIIDALPYLYMSNPKHNHVFVPLLQLIVCMAAFIVLCRSDPGVIDEDTYLSCCKVYPYDKVLYSKTNKCRTCHFLKPARSKHCAIYDRCIYKYDHYCAWVNNAIGGFNHSYFIVFLFTLSSMVVYGIYVIIQALTIILKLHHYMEARYLDENGVDHPMNYRVLIQTLFMDFPRLVLLVVSLLVILMILLSFVCYHIYLICTNQTTNERYKKHRLKKQQIYVTNPYDSGLLANIIEDFRPKWRRKKQR